MRGRRAVSTTVLLPRLFRRFDLGIVFNMAGHFALDEKNDEIAGLILEFLNGHPFQ